MYIIYNNNIYTAIYTYPPLEQAKIAKNYFNYFDILMVERHTAAVAYVRFAME